MWLNVGWSVELGLNLGLGTLPVRRHSWEWKPKEKATQSSSDNWHLFLGLLRLV